MSGITSRTGANNPLHHPLPVETYLLPMQICCRQYCESSITDIQRNFQESRQFLK
jgi:hypothetical protein